MECIKCQTQFFKWNSFVKHIICIHASDLTNDKRKNAKKVTYIFSHHTFKNEK